MRDTNWARIVVFLFSVCTESFDFVWAQPISTSLPHYVNTTYYIIWLLVLGRALQSSKFEYIKLLHEPYTGLTLLLLRINQCYMTDINDWAKNLRITDPHIHRHSCHAKSCLSEYYVYVQCSYVYIKRLYM